MTRVANSCFDACGVRRLSGHFLARTVTGTGEEDPWFEAINRHATTIRPRCAWSRSAAAVVLDRVAKKVDQHLPEPHRIGAHHAFDRLQRDLTREVSRRHSEVAVLILSMYDDAEYVCQAMQAGAKGYVLKDSPSAHLVSAVESVAGGGTWRSQAAWSGPSRSSAR
jgi:DNA-binding NarL/FixJ family response regulator